MYLARRTLTLLLLGIFLASCGGQAPAGEPTPDVNGTIAAGAQTLVASVFQTQTAAAPTVTNTVPPSVTPMPTTSPLALPSPLASPTTGFIFIPSVTPTGTFYTSTPQGLAYGCNNLQLIRSYTEPEGPFRRGQDFTQKWQVANTGTCDWLYLFSVEFASGERMGGNGHRLSNKIEPGKWTTLEVSLEAPDAPGNFSATWRFVHADGTSFGSILPVSITVQRNTDPTSTSPATPDLQKTATALALTLTAQAPTNTVAPTATPTPTNTP
jgi:hypothetical protein